MTCSVPANQSSSTIALYGKLGRKCYKQSSCIKCLQFQGSYCLSQQIDLSQQLSLELCQAQPKLDSINTKCGHNSCTALNQCQQLIYPIQYKSISSCHLAHHPPEMLTLANFQQKAVKSHHIFSFQSRLLQV